MFTLNFFNGKCEAHNNDSFFGCTKVITKEEACNNFFNGGFSDQWGNQLNINTVKDGDIYYNFLPMNIEKSEEEFACDGFHCNKCVNGNCGYFNQ